MNGETKRNSYGFFFVVFFSESDPTFQMYIFFLFYTPIVYARNIYTNEKNFLSIYSLFF